MSADSPLAPRRFDFSSQPPGEFEELCFALVRDECPDVIRLTPPDHGLDCMLPAGADGVVTWGWQAKRFTGNISWSQCRESLARAIEHHDPRHVTFCFARDLTAAQHRLFARHLVEPNPSVKVDYWAASELAARLNTHSGRVVARRFFGDPAGDADRIARAVRAGGDISTTEDLLDRQGAIGEFLAGKDPWFFYQSSVGEVDAPYTPPAPGTAIRVERIRDGVTARIDVQPRTPDALVEHGPAGRFVFSDDEVGRRAFEEISRLRSHGGRLELTEGIEVEMDRLPAGLADLLEGIRVSRTARVVVERAKVGVWSAMLRAREPDGTCMDIPLQLRPVEGPSPRGQVAICDRFGGLEVTMRLPRPGTAEKGSIQWRYASNRGVASQQLQALRFLASAHQGAEVELVDPEDGHSLVKASNVPGSLDSWLAQTLEVFEAIVRIEEINQTVFDIPEAFSERDGTALLELARMFRDGGAWVRWTDFRVVVGKDGLERLLQGGPLQVREQMFICVLGREAHVGQREVEFLDYKVASQDPPDRDGNVQVIFVPGSADSASIWTRLVPAR